eukprot:m.5642 g.5642  ORF g.5642 m.5642 type:complete len:168 (+) comp13713_c0_seq2:478-981(+)
MRAWSIVLYGPLTDREYFLLCQCFVGVGDCNLRMWSVNSPFPVQVIRCHDAEVLSCDWSKYDSNVLLTGSVDQQIRSWDIRYPSQPVAVLLGHNMAVRQIKVSPHDRDIAASCSYDFSIKLWNVASHNLLRTWTHHNEFAISIDFNPHVNGEICDCSWDEQVCIYAF